MDDLSARILALWLNSTLGILLLLSVAEVTCGPWVKFKKESLKEMPILDVNGLAQEQKEQLLRLYDRGLGGRLLTSVEFSSLPEEFANPRARRYLDEEICKALKLNIKLDSLYTLLANEPMIKGK
jgi:hypothetical protein